MKKLFKKYPALIIFIILALLLTIGFGGYEIVYHSLNHKQQAMYENLNDSAWITDFSEDEPNESTEDPSIAENEAKMKAFLESVDDPDFYKKQLNSRPNFDTYLSINDDVIGFILIPDTKIEYPVLQSDARRDYYLKRNIDGSTGYPGCIYSENMNSKEFDDPVTILYGHNMKNGTMFGQLHKYYNNDEFLQSHKYIFIYQPDAVRLYEIVAVTPYSDLHLFADNMKVNGGNIMFTGIKNDDQIRVMNHLKEYGDAKAYFSEEELTEQDNLLVLSTCSGNRARTIVAGKLLFSHKY